MKKLGIILLLFSVVLPVFGQEELMKQYAAGIDQPEMKEILTIIASDALEGRETGTRGQKMAAAFIADYFHEIGLKPVVPTPGGLSYYQKFDLESSQAGTTYLKIGDKTYANGEDVLYYGTANMSKPATGQTVYVGKGTDEDYAAVKTEGKVVVLDGSDGFFQQWRAARDKAFENGASLVVIMAKNKDKDFKNMLDHYGSYFMSSRLGFKQENQDVNAGAFLVAPTTAAALLNSTSEKMAKAVEEKRPDKIKGNSIEYLSTRETTTVETENILGYLEGTDKKDEVVVVTGHYDHIGKHNGEVNNGADDDGSGTTSVLKIAKAFAQAKKDGHGPRRSMLFMTVTGEEKGLLGSEYYVNHPIFPLDQTVVDLNIDMIGRLDDAHKDDRQFVYVVGSDKLSTELDELSKKANKEFTHLDLDYTYNDENHPDRIYYRSDHWNFAKNNIPIIFYFSGIHEDYHKPTDTVDKIQFDLLQKRAQLVFYTAWVIANRDNRLVVDKPQQENVGQH
ncbi:MAG: M28 family peptidase [Cyclobacteriaceae bacterium]|nr:M28 family peptidase [Cyclobacteriaceae bacterium]